MLPNLYGLYGRGRGLGTRAVLLVAICLFAQTVIPQGAPQDPDYTCSADKPCAVGCCSKDGFCGMGPSFCDANVCVNNCDAKADCDPSGWGPTYVKSETCPLNVCCSKFGFCGTTPEFCGDTTIASPSCSTTTANQRTVGYYEGWSPTRNCDVMYPESIAAGTYTHLNFAFASIDPDTFAVVPAEAGDVPLYQRLTGLKALYPNLKVWISIGGWSMNDPDQPTATTFSDLAASSDAQHAFFTSLITFMATYGFDGVDIDWEYPVAPERSGRPEDYANYPAFLSNLKTAFAGTGHNWGLSITLPSSFWYLQNFDIVKLEPIVDWFNMMEYDLHGTWDSTDVWVGAFVNAHTNLTEIEESLKLMWRNNISPSKVVLGLGFYGRSFTLADPSCSQPGCPFTGGAPPGPCTASSGTLSFSEIESIIASGNATVTLDEAAAVKIVTYGDGNWVSYDDAETMKTKLAYANSHCLGGTMVWAVSLDDSKGTASKSLAQAGAGIDSTTGIGKGALLSSLSSSTPNQCVFTACQIPGDTNSGSAQCPSGYGLAIELFDGCPFGGPLSGSAALELWPRRGFCCPTNQIPDCAAPIDRGLANQLGVSCASLSCPAGTTQIAKTRGLIGPSLCPTGDLNVCCTTNDAVADAVNGCKWTGNPPSCSAPNTQAACPTGTIPLVSSKLGGGGLPCTSGEQTLCCPASLPIDRSTCGWTNGLFGVCTVGCPVGKMEVAIDLAPPGCILGDASYCCDPPLSAADGVDPKSLAAFETLLENWVDGGLVCDPGTGTVTSASALVKRAGFASSLDVAKQAAPILQQQALGLTGALAYAALWQTVMNARQNQITITWDALEELVTSPPEGPDPMLAINEALCWPDHSDIGAEVNIEESDLCPAIANPHGCPEDQAELASQVTATLAYVMGTGEILDLRAPDVVIDENGIITKPKGPNPVLEMSIISPSHGLEARQECTDNCCSIVFTCRDMYIQVPPGRNFWSHIVVPNGAGQPNGGKSGTFVNAGDKDYFTSIGKNQFTQGQLQVYGDNGKTRKMFAHSYMRRGCSQVFNFDGCQLDNFGTFASFNCLGYPSCKFSTQDENDIPAFN